MKIKITENVSHSLTEDENQGEATPIVRLLRGREVDRKTKTSRSSRYAKLDPKNPAFDPQFPVPVRVGANSVRWIESEVDAYITGLPRTRISAGGNE